MNMNNHMPMMARFNRWANKRIYQAVSALGKQDYREDRGAFFGSVHNTLNHLLLVDILWSRRIQGIEHGVQSLDQILYDDFESLRCAREAEDDALVDLVDSLDQSVLNQRLGWHYLDGEGKGELEVDLILITLFNHQTHHRGQVHVLLTQSGVIPHDMDIVDYLYASREDG